MPGRPGFLRSGFPEPGFSEWPHFPNVLERETSCIAFERQGYNCSYIFKESFYPEQLMAV